MVGKNNKKWIIISLVLTGVVAVVLIAVLMNSCGNTKEEETGYTEAIFGTEPVDGQTEEVLHSEQEKDSTEEMSDSEQDHEATEGAVVSEGETERTQVGEENTSLSADEFEDVFTSGSEEVSGDSSDNVIEAESSETAYEGTLEDTSEAETVPAETATQYDGIVLPDDIFE